MSKTNQSLCQVTLALGLMFSFAGGAAARSSVQAVSIQNAELLTGGVGQTEREELLERAAEYDLFVSFAGQETGAYVSNVRVTLTSRALEHPIEVTTNGPLLLADLPEGSYTMVAALPGWKARTREVKIERGEQQQLWITFLPEGEGP